MFNGLNSKIVTWNCFLQDSCTTSQGDWTPYNGNLHMQGIKVLVNNPCPPVKREGAFEDTMFLIDLLKQSREKEIKEKKVCQLSLENKGLIMLPFNLYRRI